MIIEIKPTPAGRFAVFVDGKQVGQPCKTEDKAKNVAADYERGEAAKAARNTPEAVEARRLRGQAKQKAKATAAAQAAKAARAAKRAPPVRRRITSLPPATVDVEVVAQVLGLRIPRTNLNLNAPTTREVRSAVQEALAEVEVEIRRRQRQLAHQP